MNPELDRLGAPNRVAYATGARRPSDPARTLHVAVIGAGSLGTLHAAQYEKLPCCELSAVVDSRYEAAARLASRHSAQAQADFHEVLQQVDAVSITTPASSHFRIAHDCLEAGVDVLLGQPVGADPVQTQCLTQLAAAQGRVLQLGLGERYHPAIRALAQLRLRPLFVDFRREISAAPGDRDVDVILDLMAHDIDLALSLIGSSVVDFEVRADRVNGGGIDAATAWLRFDDGCEAHLFADRMARTPRQQISIFESNAYACADLLKGTLDAAGVEPNVAMQPLCGDAITAQIVAFSRCVRRRITPEVDSEQLIVALDLARRLRARLAVCASNYWSRLLHHAVH